MIEDGPWTGGASPTAMEALHLRLAAPFEDAVAFVQLEHELAGFETISLTRVDRLVAEVLDDEVVPLAMLVVCHAELARDALEIDPRVAALLPCTTVVYDPPDDDYVHVHHLSATKAIRDLRVAPSDRGAAVERLVEATGERMAAVWATLEASDAAVDDP
ncbi:MAG: DUF302 domain-containing protein [Halobacteriales archaeon]